MKTILSIALLIFCLPMLASAQQRNTFPYPITQADVPAGFFPAGPFDKETRQESMSANQGIVTDKKLFGTLYDHARTDAISRIFAAVYIPKKSAEDALECYVVEYKTAALLEKEQLKLVRQSGSRYLKRAGIYLSSGRMVTHRLYSLLLIIYRNDCN